MAKRATKTAGAPTRRAAATSPADRADANERDMEASAQASTDASIAEGQANAEFRERAMARNVERAERETELAEKEGRTPATMAVTNPAPTNKMNPSSGAFVEDEILDSVPADHPSVENNPRRGTSSVMNGGDFNDPFHRDPKDPEFSGQGLDLSVYGGGPGPTGNR